MGRCAPARVVVVLVVVVLIRGWRKHEPQRETRRSRNLCNGEGDEEDVRDCDVTRRPLFPHHAVEHDDWAGDGDAQLWIVPSMPAMHGTPHVPRNVAAPAAG